jgi:hypothetical protein
MHIDVIAFLVVLAGELFNFAKPATALILVVHVKWLRECGMPGGLELGLSFVYTDGWECK